MLSVCVSEDIYIHWRNAGLAELGTSQRYTAGNCLSSTLCMWLWCSTEFKYWDFVCYTHFKMYILLDTTECCKTAI